MKVLLITNFPSNLDGGAKGRFLYLGEMMGNRGHEVEMIVSDFNHDKKTHRLEGEICHSDYLTKITVLHETGYRKNVSLARLWSHYVWGCNVRRFLKSISKPDVIYCAVPSLTAARAAATYCTKNEVKLVVDIQDLWPEAFAMVIKSKLLQKAILPMKWYIDKAFAAADIAIAVSESYVNRILSVNKKIKKCFSVFLGNDGEMFDEGRLSYHLERSGNEIVVGYIGNMSTSYDIPCVLDALSILKERGSVSLPIRFVLIGGGVDEEAFMEYAQMTYKNTCFLGRKSYREMAGLLCGCDIAVNPIVKGSVASIINKVGDYALAGLPVVNTQESTEYRALIDFYQCGINCECGNSEEVANAIEQLSMDKDLRIRMGDNARKLGKDKFDRRITYPLIVEALEALN